MPAVGILGVRRPWSWGRIVLGVRANNSSDCLLLCFIPRGAYTKAARSASFPTPRIATGKQQRIIEALF
jgi:hypothetical protein